jgi:hypothetical protein
MILCISSDEDRTMAYFVDFVRGCTTQPPHHLSWQSLAAGPALSSLAETIAQYSGCYVREPAISAVSQHALIRTVYSLLHRNGVRTICPGSRSTNWSKSLHYLATKRQDAAGARRLRSPATVVGLPGCRPSYAAIIKGISNIPSRVSDNHEDFDRNNGLEDVSYPRLVQQRISGSDLRVHILGGHFFCFRLHHPKAIDYRSGPLEAEPVDLPDWAYEELRCLTRSEGLVFSGADLIQDGAGNYWILEINPMPGYHSFEAALSTREKPISNQILRYLSKGETS